MWTDQLSQDVRFATRAMRSSPVFTIAAVLVLSIGIGATVAAFSAFSMVALRPLPVRDPDTLIRIERHAPSQSASEVPARAVAFYREHARTLSNVLAQTTVRMPLDGANESVPINVVSADFLEELGAHPVHGRLLSSGDGSQSSSAVAVIGYRFWEQHFGAAPAVVGTTIRLNGTPTTIVGIVNVQFSGLGGVPPAFWLPLTDATVRPESQLTMWGRLAPGGTIAAVEEELGTLAASLRRQHPDAVWEHERLVGKPAGYGDVGSAEMSALVVALVLLILVVACANLGSLLLARGMSRQREMALRIAIGAGAGRLIRQLLTESLVLGMLGAAGGLALGSLVLRGVMVWTDAPPWFDATPDGTVILFTVSVGVIASMMFGLAPALRLSRPAARTRGARPLLIGAQVAASCILLIVAGLLTRAFEHAAVSDPGFEYERVLVLEPGLIEHGYTQAQAGTYWRTMQDRLGAIPGVESMGLTSTPPLGSARITALMQIDGRPLEIYINQVDSRYMATMEIPVLRGRSLSTAEPAGLVVSASLVQRYWPDRDPIGQTFRIGNDAFTVVGIAGNARTLALGDPETAEVYRLIRDGELVEAALVVRTSTATDVLAPTASAMANGVETAIRPRLRLLKDMHRQQTQDVRQGALAVSLLGMIALAVACLGVVGLVSYSVAQRTKDIGIRLALGAESRHVVWSLTTQFRWAVMGGLVVGIAGAAGVAQLLRRELYGVSPVDPLAYAGAMALFVVTVSIAAIWPARRAMRVDPLQALRAE